MKCPLSYPPLRPTVYSEMTIQIPNFSFETDDGKWPTRNGSGADDRRTSERTAAGTAWSGACTATATTAYHVRHSTGRSATESNGPNGNDARCV